MPFWENLPIINDIPLDVRVGITRVFAAIVVFLIIWLLRNLIGNLLKKPFISLARRTNTPLDDTVIEAVSGATVYIVTGIAILVSLLIIGLDAGVREFFENLGASFILFGIAKFIYDIGAQLTDSETHLNQYTGISVSREILPIVRIVVKILVIIFTLMIALQIWNINIAGLLAGVGLGGLALSLAAKEILDDVLGFIIIMTDKPFKLDEYIISPHGEGIVEQVGLRATYIRRLDQGLTIIPNNTIANDPLTNWSRLEQRWFNFMLGVTYDSTAAEIENLAKKLRETLRGREKVKDDSVVVAFTEYDDSSLNLLVRCYVDIADWTEAKMERHAVNLEIRRLVEKLDMNIAFPSRSLYLEQIPSGLAANGTNNGNGKPRMTDGKTQRANGQPHRSTFHQDDENHEIQSAEEGNYDDAD